MCRDPDARWADPSWEVLGGRTNTYGREARVVQWCEGQRHGGERDAVDLVLTHGLR